MPFFEPACLELHYCNSKLQVGVGIVVTSGSLGGVMVSTLVWNTRDVASILILGTIFPIFITPMTLVAVIMNLYKLHAVWLLNVPCVSEVTFCM